MSPGVDGTPATPTFVPGAEGELPALFLRPPDAAVLLVLAHGAGAGMSHPFLSELAGRLAWHGVATLRFEFPYMAGREPGRRRPPDRAPVLAGTVRSAVDRARELDPELPLFAGGKSMGGRMTSLAAAEAPLVGLRGIVFVGFPLHPRGRPSIARAEHLERVPVPMLFLQGTRDPLADLALLEPVVARLGDRARLRVVEGADHGFHVLGSSGRTDASVLDELAAVAAEWMVNHA